MTSEKKRQANRANARRGTGPRTRAGKRRSRQNALKHGLTAKLRDHPVWHDDIERLAGALAPNVDDPVALDHARIAAEAQLQAQRARHAKAVLYGTYTPRGAPTYWGDQRQTIRAIRNGLKAMRVAERDPEEFWQVQAFAWRQALPIYEPERSAVFTVRAAPTLTRLDVYAAKAMRRRNRELVKLKETLVGRGEPIHTEIPPASTTGETNPK